MPYGGVPLPANHCFREAGRLPCQKKEKCAVDFADMTAPPLPCICAAGDLEGEKSLGSILAATHVTENLIKKNCMFYRKMIT